MFFVLGLSPSKQKALGFYQHNMSLGQDVGTGLGRGLPIPANGFCAKLTLRSATMIRASPTFFAFITFSFFWVLFQDVVRVSPMAVWRNHREHAVNTSR